MPEEVEDLFDWRVVLAIILVIAVFISGGSGEAARRLQQSVGDMLASPAQAVLTVLAVAAAALTPYYIYLGARALERGATADQRGGSRSYRTHLGGVPTQTLHLAGSRRRGNSRSEVHWKEIPWHRCSGSAAPAPAQTPLITPAAPAETLEAGRRVYIPCRTMISVAGMREGLAILVIAIVVLAVGAYMMGSSMARQGEERTVAYTATYTAYAPAPGSAAQTVTIAVGSGQVYTVTQAQPQLHTYTYTYTQRYAQTSTVTVTVAKDQDLEARYRQLLEDYNWLKQEYNKAMLTIANLTSANAELSRRVAELEARLKQLEAEIASVRSQLPFNGSVVVLSRVVDLSSCKGTKAGTYQRTVFGWSIYKFYLTGPAFTYHTPDFSVYVYCYIEWVNSTHFYFAALMILGKPAGLPPDMPDEPQGLGLVDIVIAPALRPSAERLLYYNPPPDWQLLGHTNRTVAASMYFVAYSVLEIVGFYRSVIVWRDGKVLGMDPYDVMSVPPHRVWCTTRDPDYTVMLAFGMVLSTSCIPVGSQDLAPPDQVPMKVVPKGYSLLIAQAMVGGIADPQWVNATKIGLYIRVAA